MKIMQVLSERVKQGGHPTEICYYYNYDDEIMIVNQKKYWDDLETLIRAVHCGTHVRTYMPIPEFVTRCSTVIFEFTDKDTIIEDYPEYLL